MAVGSGVLADEPGSVRMIAPASRTGERVGQAAPINPGELGRNVKYVFALPARYNYAFPTGYQEVEKILEGKPLRGF